MHCAPASMRAPPPDPRTLSTSELTSHIIWTHHRLLRETLPYVQRTLHRSARADGERRPQLHALARAVDELAGVLIPHILVEERFLFPAMTATPPDQEVLRSELLETADEHAVIGRLLDRVHALVGACGLQGSSMLAARLAWIEADTRRHLTLEEEVLLPRFARTPRGRPPR